MSCTKTRSFVEFTPKKTRCLAFDGAINFRELGGYQTCDGRRLRWGKLYRSEHLGHLSHADVGRLEQLKLRCICDFRGPAERRRAPDTLPVRGAPRVVHLAVDQRALVSGATAAKTLRKGVTAQDLTRGMKESYRRMVSHCSAQYGAFMQLLCDNRNLPFLMHCTGGKDRAGFAAAMLLSALGVPRDTVFQDYLLTNELVAPSLEGFAEALVHSLDFDLAADVVAPLFVADASYLQESFEEIGRLHTSVDNYFRQGLGLTDEQRRSLQEELLEA